MILRRGNVTDVFTEDGRSAVMVNAQVLVLSEVASTVVAAVPGHDATEFADVVEAVVDAYGSPPGGDPGAAVAEHVEGLIAHGVLRRDDPVPSVATPEAVSAVRDALRHLLSDSPRAWHLDDEVPAAQFLAAVQRHRVGPALADAGDRLALPAAARAGLAAVRSNETATVAALTRDLTEALHALERASIRTITFKGLALAAQAHGDPSARGTGDHDLLVHPDDVVRALSVLSSLGWKLPPTVPAPGPSWAWRQFHRCAYEAPLHRGGHMIDLHWHLVADQHSFGDFADLWARRDTVRIGGREIATLGRYDALRHSAAHATTDERRYLRGLYDISLLLRDARTWAGADRPFTHGELISVGVATTLLGAAPHAPAVVHEAAAAAASATEAALRQQANQPPPTTANWPGKALVAAVGTAVRARRSPADLARQLSTSVFLPKFTALEPSPHAIVAAPRALARRLRDAAERASVASRRATAHHSPHRGARP